MSASPGARAVASLEIDDVFLIQTNCHVDEAYNQSQLTSSAPTLFRFYVQPKVLSQTRTPLAEGESQIHILRYTAIGETLVLKQPHTDSNVDPSPENVVAKMLHRFAIDYACPPDILHDRELVGAFSKNVAFHCWGYWREAVHETGARMRLPRFTIPMFKANMGVDVVSAASVLTTQET